MFKNIYWNSKFSTMHLWEQIKGEDFYTEIPWVPYLFELSEYGTIKTIDGKLARKLTFKNYNTYYTYQQESNNVLENNVKPEIQFLTERYYGIPDDELEIPKLKIYSLDIEVQGFTERFANITEAEDPITIISVHNCLNNTTTSFGIHPYTGEYSKEKWLTYIQCNNDTDLLKKFLTWMHENPPDVITGWNVQGYDLLYIKNRCDNLFGEDNSWFPMLSPLEIVKSWKSKSSNDINIDIAGVCILDYMDLYKWFSKKKPERHTLDYICNLELGKGKVEYEYKNLFELYNSDWNSYVKYNIIDSLRVSQLEEKLGYIKLVQSLSLLSKAPMKYYSGQTNLIEGILLTYYRRNNMCAPRLYGGSQETYEAAYVKESLIGLYDWNCDLDIGSSYPHQIVTLNMSPETYYGRIVNMIEDEIIHSVKNKSFSVFHMDTNRGRILFDSEKLETFHKALSRRMLAVSPCGSVFVTTPTGVVPEAEKYLFRKRVLIRKRSREMKQSLPELRDDDLRRTKEKIKQFESLQTAFKLILNAMYGILAVPYSRYFNTNIAEAVCSCGRLSVKSGEKFVNKLLNGPTPELMAIIDKFGKFTENEKPVDYVLAMDTDSLFINLGGFLDDSIGKEWRNQNDEDIKVLIRNLAGVIEDYVNDHVYREVQRKAFNSNEEEFRIFFKQEIIAKSALFVKKKKYAVWVVDDDKVAVDEVKTTGLEIIRSDTPEIVKPMLIEILEMILKGASELDIQVKIQKYENELYEKSAEELAVNIGAHNIDKYVEDDAYMTTLKGTPWHVKGIANYRMLLKSLKIENKYPELTENSKVKVVYVKKNPYKMESISFTEWPKEFDRVVQVDYDKMIQNFFLGKIKILLEPMNKTNLLNHDAAQNLNFFFQ